MQGDGQDQGSDQGQGSQQDAGQQSQQDQSDDQFDKDRAMATIRTQRESENALKQQLKEAQDKLREIEDKDKSETQKLAGEVADLKKQLEAKDAAIQKQTREVAGMAAVTSAGAKYPEDLWSVISREVEYDAENKPTNLKALIERYRKDRPDYFKPGAGKGSADGGARTTAAASPDMNQIIRDQARAGR